MTSIPDFRGTHLWDRLAWAQANLTRVEPKYRCVYEDPAEPDAPVKIMVPAPEWLACALAGGILPPIETYLHDQAAEAKWTLENPGKPFSYDQVGGATHPYADPIAAMTEEEAMEYLVMKDVPQRVWGQLHNRPMFAIVRVEQIPTDRRNRNQWKLSDLLAA
jgi:hypothetical protein